MEETTVSSKNNSKSLEDIKLSEEWWQEKAELKFHLMKQYFPQMNDLKMLLPEEILKIYKSEYKQSVILKSMVETILEMDYLGTDELCNKYGLPHPYFTGDTKSSANMFLTLDVIKHKKFVEYAKFLNKKLKIGMFVGPDAIFEGFEIRKNFENKKVLARKGENQVFSYISDEFEFRFPRDANKIEDLLTHAEHFPLNKSGVIKSNSYLAFLFK